MAKNIIHSELEYTGGGIWCAWGQFEDGTFFSGGDNMGFFLWDADLPDILDREDAPDPTFLSPGWDGSESHVLGYTVDDSEETFEMWLQIYDQHPECIDLEELKEDLYFTFNKDSERMVKATLNITFKELEFLNDQLGKMEQEARENLFSPEEKKMIENIFLAVHDAYADNR